MGYEDQGTGYDPGARGHELQGRHTLEDEIAITKDRGRAIIEKAIDDLDLILKHHAVIADEPAFRQLVELRNYLQSKRNE